MSSPDYLNNLSPDSKEYEDTQGKPSAWILTHTLQLLDMYQVLVVESQPLSVFIELVAQKSLLSFIVCVAAALVIVSEVADQANDNLKQGVSSVWIHPMGLLSDC